MHLPTKTQRDEAETLALNIASFLFAEDERLATFLGTTGIDAIDLKRSLATTDVQIGILEYLLSREDFLLEFCELNNIDPEYQRPQLQFSVVRDRIGNGWDVIAFKLEDETVTGPRRHPPNDTKSGIPRRWWYELSA